MNLYKYLRENVDRQKKFCDDLVKDIPLIIEYMKSYNSSKDILWQDLSVVYINIRDYHVSVDIKTNYTSSSDISGKNNYQCYNMLEHRWFNIFNIFNMPIEEYTGWGFLDGSNMSYEQITDLQPIVKNWLIKYEKNILRQFKLERILWI